MKSVGLLGCLVFVGCAAAAPKPAVLATNSALVPVPAAEPATKAEAPKPVEAAPAPVESDEVLPKIEFTPEGQLRVNTKAKLQAALKAIKNQTSASAVQGILTRSLGKPTWIEDDAKHIGIANDATQCLRLVLQADGSVDFEALRSTESKTVSRTARQNLCTGKIERDE